jgi:hypothetical protein
MAGLNITFTIPEAKVAEAVTALNGLYPKPDDFVGNDNQWAKEVIRRWVRDQIARYEQKVAKDAIAFLPDDTIIQ